MKNNLFLIALTGVTITAYSLISSQALMAAENRLPSTPQQMQLESNVQGQQSQPKVLFILPWEENVQSKEIQVDDSLINEDDFLAPIDRHIFRQEIKMYKQLDNRN